MDDDALEAELDAYLERAFDAPTADEMEELEPPRNADQADLLLRRRGGVLRSIAQVDGLVDRRVEAMRAWGRDRTAGLYKALGQIDGALEAWTRAALAGRRTKTERLPHGSVSLRGHREVVRVLDEAAFQQWAEGAGKADLMLKAPEQVRKPVLAEVQRLTGKGEQLPDVTDEGGTAWERWSAVDPTTGEKIPNVEYRRQKADDFKIA